MIVLEKEKKLDEFMSVNYDKARRMGSLSGWQKQLYNLVTVRYADSILDRLMTNVNKSLPHIAPDGTDSEEIKNVLKTALMDYIDSVF